METFFVDTTRRNEFVNITPQVGRALAALLAGRGAASGVAAGAPAAGKAAPAAPPDKGAASGAAHGALLVFCPHTTAAITLNENADPDVPHDLLLALDRLAPRLGGFRHAEGNSDAHLKASLVGASALVPLHGGRPMLGTWQGIWLCEFDGPRRRQVLVQLLAGGAQE